jgi:hypothetical protein
MEEIEDDFRRAIRNMDLENLTVKEEMEDVARRLAQIVAATKDRLPR